MGFSKPSGDNLRVHGAKKKPEKTGPRSYNSYFEGYTEFYETDSNGKRHKRYVYTDPYYRQDLSRKQRIGLKLFYSFAYLLATVLFLYAAFRPYVSMLLWYTQAVCFFLLLWLLYILAAFYLPTRANLTAYLYKKSSLPLKRVSLCASIALAVLALSLLLCLIVDPNVRVLSGLLAVLSYFAAGILVLAMYLTERKIKYIRVNNDSVVPEDGYKIINDAALPSKRSNAVSFETQEK